MQFFLFPALIVAAWFLSGKRSELVRKACRSLALVVLCLLFALAVTGLLRSGESEIHKWLGHGLLIVVWLTVPIGIGSTLQRNLAPRRSSAVCHTVLLFGVLGVALLSSVTGYLGPLRNEGISEESLNRFIVLHKIVFPAALATLSLAWLWCFRRNDRGAP